MPTPAEHFLDFLALVTASPMSEPSADPSADPGSARLVRAMAGESTARFRDRIILERAAHLVMSTDRTLQDIVADSGFRGYDVFTRAFRREYGALPSEWRVEPTSWLLESHNDVHFHPPAGLRLPARQRVDSPDLLTELVEHHLRAVGDLVDRAGLIGEDDLDRAVPDLDGPRTLRSSLSGLVARMEELVTAVHGRPYDDRADEVAERGSLQTVRRRLDAVAPELVEVVEVLSATGRWDEVVIDAFSPAPTLRSHAQVVAHLLSDADHLRLLALIRLRECEVTQPLPRVSAGSEPPEARSS